MQQRYASPCNKRQHNCKVYNLNFEFKMVGNSWRCLSIKFFKGWPGQLNIEIYSLRILYFIIIYISKGNKNVAYTDLFNNGKSFCIAEMPRYFLRRNSLNRNLIQYINLTYTNLKMHFCFSMYKSVVIHIKLYNIN